MRTPNRLPTATTPKLRRRASLFSLFRVIRSKIPNAACSATTRARSNRSSIIRRMRRAASGAMTVTHRISPKRRKTQGANAYRERRRSFFRCLPFARRESLAHQQSAQRRANCPELCYNCHGDVRAQFALPTHHRVPEGLMKCTDCHTPPGTQNRHELTQSGYETCAHCHAEKLGPFNVRTCYAVRSGRLHWHTHTPRGSVNRQLLARREERMLCLQCHSAPEASNAAQPHEFSDRRDMYTLPLRSSMAQISTCFYALSAQRPIRHENHAIGNCGDDGNCGDRAVSCSL